MLILDLHFSDGEAIQIQLDLYNICCSTGSACNAGVKAVSHVLSQIKVPEMYIHGSVRFLQYRNLILCLR